MFNFWTRRSRKLSTGQSQKSANVLPLSQLDVPDEGKTSSPLPVNLAEDPSDQPKVEESNQVEPLTTNKEEPRDEQTSPPQSTPIPYVPATPNPHDGVISEIKNGLRQIEILTGGPRRSEQTGDSHPSSDHALAEPLFDPATGEQRGTFENPHPILPIEGTGNPPSDTTTKATHEEIWSHLAHIRELQSDIAKVHAHMEGIGDARHILNVDVDADIDLDSVPTQEEEEAVKREMAFKELPKRFNGRSKNIDIVMSKLDELSKAVTTFHALQPPPLHHALDSDEMLDDFDKVPPSLSSRPSIPVNNLMSFQTSLHSPSGVGPRSPFSSVLGQVHESPTSIGTGFADL